MNKKVIKLRTVKEQGTYMDLPIVDYQMGAWVKFLTHSLLFSDAITRIDNLLLLMDKDLARENVGA